MRNWILRTLVVFAMARVGCAASSSALEPAAPQAHQIADLFALFLWITGVVYGLVILAMLFTLRRKNPGEPGPVLAADPRVERTTTMIVSTCVGITAALLFTMMIAEFVTERRLHASEPNPLSVQIIGRQWWWEVQYHDGSPSNWVITANELHVPTGRMINFDLQSSDVIHSFWFPSLNGKKDLVPGHPTTTFFKVEKPGTYFGQCAEFCGLQHAHMRLMLVAEEPSKFAKWYKAQQQTPSDPSGDSEKKGKQLFLTTSCVLCHSVSGTTAAATFGPNLSHVAARRMIGSGTLTNEPDALAKWVSDPQKFKPGAKMPANHFKPDDLQSVVAYLRSLK